jgi:hypothetical protein
MSLHAAKDFALHFIARQAASDRAKIGRAHKTAVALHYIPRQAASDLRLSCGRHALSRRPGKTGGYAASFISASPERFCMPGYQRQNVFRRFSFKTCVSQKEKTMEKLLLVSACVRECGFLCCVSVIRRWKWICGRLTPL